MQPVPQELLKQYVQSQQFTSTADIMSAMKEMFRDIIQQVMEVEMDEELGRERCQRAEATETVSPNYRNGYSQKKVKTQLGEIDIKIPRDRKGNYEPKIIEKYDRNAEVDMKKRFLAVVHSVRAKLKNVKQYGEIKEINGQKQLFKDNQQYKVFIEFWNDLHDYLTSNYDFER